MIHRVIAAVFKLALNSLEKVDAGEVICKREVEFIQGDTLERLEERIHILEHELIVEGIKLMLDC
jgi:phosphoribosylglycinamide formyltransferase